LAGPSLREDSPRGRASAERVVPSQGIPAIVVLLALGLVLRFIIAYVLFPGSGFPNDLGAFQAWGNDIAQQRPDRLLRPARLHRLSPRLSSVARCSQLPDRRQHRRGCEGRADVRRPGARGRGLADGQGPRRQQPPSLHRGADRPRQPDHLVQQRNMGPGGLGRFDLPAAGPARAAEGPSRGGLGAGRPGRADQDAARASWDSSSVSSSCVGRWRPRPASPSRSESSARSGAGLATAALVCLPFTGLDLIGAAGRIASPSGLITVAVGLVAGVGVFSLSRRYLPVVDSARRMQARRCSASARSSPSPAWSSTRS
jgi:hypothetical protein